MIDGQVSGDREVLRMLGRLSPEMQSATVKATGRLVLMLQARVKMKLSGDVLNVRTGRLRRSITQRIEQTATEVSGVVGTNVNYGKAHEFGGPQEIKEHLRLVKQAFGKDLRMPVWATVKTHTRTLPERSFLRSALRDLAASGAIETEFKRAVGYGVKAATR